MKKEVNFEKEIALAKEKCKKRSEEDEFELKELFNDEEWSKINGVRLFGKEFKKQVDQGEMKNINFVRRGQNRHAKYKKVNEDE